MENQMEKLLSFLAMDRRPDIQLIALQSVLDLTGNVESLSELTEKKVVLLLISLLKNTNTDISKRSALILVNVSADFPGAKALLMFDETTKQFGADAENLIDSLLSNILNPNSRISDPCCMILSNITRWSQLIEVLIDILEKSSVLEDLIDVFTKNKFNKIGQNLYYLGPVLSNLSQSGRVRKFLLNKDSCIIQRLLPFTEFKESIIKRGGTVGALRNCCLDPDYHMWLLSDQIDILPRLLLPLAGNSEFDEEDNDKLPLELQFLPDDKVREEDPDIRCMLIEAITQLCAIRENRQFIRDRNTYVILRELHKWEKDKKALLACENLVNILIRTEDEIGADNLRDLEIPDHLHDKFDQMDEDSLSNT